MTTDQESDAPRPARTRRAVVVPVLAVLAYAILLGVAASSIAFFDSELRADWAPLVIAGLFPVGEVAYTASQLIGGFLTAAGGLTLGNAGAAIPLFVSGVAMGTVQGGLVAAVIQGLRWALRSRTR